MKKLSVLGLMLIVAALAYAQEIPNKINYQGRLTDDAGQPVASGEYVLSFSVWDVSRGLASWTTSS